MANLLKGDLKTHKMGTIFAGSYIAAMAFSWLLASEALIKILGIISWPGLWLAEQLVVYLRREQGVTWMASFTPPDLSVIIESPLGAQAMSILIIGVLFTVVILYVVGYQISKRVR